MIDDEMTDSEGIHHYGKRMRDKDTAIANALARIKQTEAELDRYRAELAAAADASQGWAILVEDLERERDTLARQLAEAHQAIAMWEEQGHG